MKRSADGPVFRWQFEVKPARLGPIVLALDQSFQFYISSGIGGVALVRIYQEQSLLCYRSWKRVDERTAIAVLTVATSMREILQKAKINQDNTDKAAGDGITHKTARHFLERCYNGNLLRFPA
ncbi:hypothetical protein [Rhizobium multihospitium]|uniref:hypothetical protein n=1 Tax=Rhizobium multihospitium TaxID=410764 RepID=UPI00114CCD93|nr:hypothetical protein [Rhizobium multihospitium]